MLSWLKSYAASSAGAARVKLVRMPAVPVTLPNRRYLVVIEPGALGVIYGLGGWQTVVAGRWKGQINENAKQPCFWHELPELDHNELAGWEGAKDLLARFRVGDVLGLAIERRLRNFAGDRVIERGGRGVDVGPRSLILDASAGLLRRLPL